MYTYSLQRRFLLKIMFCIGLISALGMVAISLKPQITPLQRMQKKVICLITFSDFDAHTSPLLFQLKLLKLQDHINLQTLYFMHQFFTGKLPKIFDSFFY